jgi:hypothetical protein
VAPLRIGGWPSYLLASAIACALKEVDSRDRRQPMEVFHRENQRPLYQAMDHYLVTARIDFGHSRMMNLVMQRGGRDNAEQVL